VASTIHPSHILQIQIIKISETNTLLASSRRMASKISLAAQQPTIAQSKVQIRCFSSIWTITHNRWIRQLINQEAILQINIKPSKHNRTVKLMSIAIIAARGSS